MQKNWYVVYTKPHNEKKVSSFLTKSGIENFCPLNFRKIRSFRRNKIVKAPLFKSYVFAYTTITEVALFKQINGAINSLYWRNAPAVIKQDDINAIKEFTRNRQQIELALMQVNMHDAAQVIQNPSYSREGNILTVKNKILKIALPSLGYVMKITVEDESIFERFIPGKAFRLGIHSEIQQQVN